MRFGAFFFINVRIYFARFFLFLLLLKRVRGNINWTAEQWKEFNFSLSLWFCCAITIYYPEYLPDKKVMKKYSMFVILITLFQHLHYYHVLYIFWNTNYTQSAVLYRSCFGKTEQVCSYKWSLKDNLCDSVLGFILLINTLDWKM